MLTNADGAVDFKVMTCEPGATERTHWRDFVAYEPGRYILALEATKNFLTRMERINALPRIVVRHVSGEEHAIALDEGAYHLDMMGGYEYETSVQRYVYNSPTTPLQSVRLRHGVTNPHLAKDAGNPLRPRPRKV